LLFDFSENSRSEHDQRICETDSDNRYDNEESLQQKKKNSGGKQKNRIKKEICSEF
jgi:hypothetical protein